METKVNFEHKRPITIEDYLEGSPTQALVSKDSVVGFHGTGRITWWLAARSGAWQGPRVLKVPRFLQSYLYAHSFILTYSFIIVVC